MAEATCSIDGCDRPVSCRSWCRRHYDHWQRHGDPLTAINRFHFGALCSVEGCTTKAKSRGWCGKHYIRWTKTGDPLVTPRQRRVHLRTTKRCTKCRESLPVDRFWKNAAQPDGYQQMCKPCIGARNAATNRRRAARRLRAFCEAHDWTCGICAQTVEWDLPARHPQSVSVDLIIPVALGGTNDPANLQLAHLVCNMRKGARV